MARLLGISIPEVRENQKAFALRSAAQWGCTVLLKGARSVVAAPDGRFAWNETGNPGLAKGGSGDVLAGIIGAFTAQGLTPSDAASAGVFVHGKAADLARDRLSEAGMLPRDVIDELPYVFKAWNR